MLLAAACACAAFVVPASASAIEYVRVEQPSSTPVDRTPVSPTLPVTLETGPNSVTCPATSPVAALRAANVAFEWTVDAAQKVTLTSIAGTLPSGTNPQNGLPNWTWTAFGDFRKPTDVCTGVVPNGVEAVFIPRCADPNRAGGCFVNPPLWIQIRDGDIYTTDTTTVPGRNAPVEVRVFQGAFTGDATATTAAQVKTDENRTFGTNDPHKEGIASVSFAEPGPHTITATAPGAASVRAKVCVTDGSDGFCGTTKVNPPDEIPYNPSPCLTNGHDGFCGTTDTSGPVTHVSNITHKKVFTAKKAPGQVKGTIETDPNGVKDVQLRLTRVATARVKVKAAKRKKGSKKKPKARYRTVKRCSAWSDATALLVTQKKCGGKYAKWFTADLSDLRNEFTYSFAMTLPKGTYTLEVLATDEDGHKDATSPGRNVLTFTVK